jgi:DNA-binding transcriptional MerR regulator
MKQYSIKDLERFTGIKAHTIRIWEQRYDIVEPYRTDTNIRIYYDEDLKKLLNVGILVKNGHKISKVAKYSESEIKTFIYEIEKNALDNNTEAVVESLIKCCIDFDEDAFEKTFSHALLRLGFEDTLMKIIYPTMVRIGVMWGVNEFSPAQEHFFSHLIKKKIYVAIDGVNQNDRLPDNTYLLYLPFWEEHDLGLLMAYFLLRKHKANVIYLGPNVPIDSIADLPEEIYSKIFTFLTAKEDSKVINKHLSEISKRYANKELFITASENVINEGVQIPENFKRLIQPFELVQTI